MKKIYLSMAVALIASSAFNQSVATPNNQKGIAKKMNASYDAVKKKNNINTRATNISHWISFDDAYSSYMGSTPQLATMINGAFVNDTNVSQQYDNGGATVDTAFVAGAYSVIDLGGTYYTSTIFNPNIQPFMTTEDLTIDSVFAAFTYQKFDNTAVDTVVVRVAIPGASQMTNLTSWNAPYNTHPTSGDTISWVIVNYNVANKKIANTVAEYKVALDAAFLSDPNNLVNGTDLDWFNINVDANDVLTGHGGLLAIEVNVIHGRQLTPADTVGVNANLFTPTWISLDATTPPAYSDEDFTDGGQLYINEAKDATGTGIFYNHWFGNSAQGVTEFGGIDPFQSPWVNLKITQNNTATASINEIENGAKLFQNYPNPTSDMTTIKYALENGANVSFEIIDITGKVITSSFEGQKSQGTHTIELNTNALNAGVYFYSIVVNGNKLTKKMTIAK